MVERLKNDEKIILLATFNPGKVREYKILLKNLKTKLVSLKDLKIKKKVEEDGKTFEENAKLKAEFYSKLTGFPALADDGGLEIDILGGEPGVKSRRWPGYEATDKELIKLVLEKLKNVPFKARKARLRAVLAFKIPGRKTLLFEAQRTGFVTKKPYGELMNGYPYRSIFYLPRQGKTYNCLSFKEEIRLNHRAKAVRKLVSYLRKNNLI